MSEVYVLVEVKKSILRILLAYIVLFFALSCLFLLFKGATFLFLPAVILFIIWYFVMFKGNLEYEYSYFDGDIRFAKVKNKSKRKQLKSYNIEEVIQIAPAGDRSVYNYENDNAVKVKDFTSKVSGVPYYDMVIRDGENGTILFKVELDDKYLDAVCVKHASKVIRR